MLVGFDTSDDACVYRISDDLALVQTVDFFPPMVDDPYIFGQIAAANALSDVYAMGAVPTHAMNLLCFPNCLSLDIAAKILEGGASKAAEAGCPVVGGHTIADDEPKYGLCVSGLIDPKAVLLNSSARAGDALVLTKPLGTGILTTAYKGGLVDDAQMRCAIDSMRQLNKYAAEAAKGLDVHACTDITGFGLAGHLCEMAEGSGLTAVIVPENIPALPFSLDMARMGLIPAGAYRNRDHFGCHTALDTLALELSDLLFDPQTSGGLLFAIDPSQTDTLLRRLRDAGISGALLGEMTERDEDGMYLKAIVK